MAPATSPSVMSRMRAPEARTSAMRSAWRWRSKMTAVRSRTGWPRASARAVEVLGRGPPDVDGARGPGPDGQLLHVDAGTGVEHGAAFGHGDDGQAPPRPERGGGRAVDGVDGDVGGRRRPVADPLAVEEHGGVVLLALADDHHAVHGTDWSTTRMALTAAPSAPSLSPRPIQRLAAMAAASVTRTSSMARLRSGPAGWVATAMTLVGPSGRSRSRWPAGPPVGVRRMASAGARPGRHT